MVSASPSSARNSSRDCWRLEIGQVVEHGQRQNRDEPRAWTGQNPPRHQPVRPFSQGREDSQRLLREAGFDGGQGRVHPGLDGRHIGELAMPGDADPQHAYCFTAALARSPLLRASTMV